MTATLSQNKSRLTKGLPRFQRPSRRSCVCSLSRRACCCRDWTIKEWNIQTMVCRRTLVGHAAVIFDFEVRTCDVTVTCVFASLGMRSWFAGRPQEGARSRLKSIHRAASIALSHNAVSLFTDALRKHVTIVLKLPPTTRPSPAPPHPESLTTLQLSAGGWNPSSAQICPVLAPC